MRADKFAAHLARLLCRRYAPTNWATETENVLVMKAVPMEKTAKLLNCLSA
jgi:hypothetical protein